MEDKIGSSRSIPGTVYHYTSLDSLMGMVNTNNLWMTRGTFLNDTNELLYIESVLQTVLDKIKLTLPEYDSHFEWQQIFLSELEATLKRFIENVDLDEFEVYILSLTENKDSLALWYPYAGGDGYNIGFSSDHLLNHIQHFASNYHDAYHTVHGSVIYEFQQQEKVLYEFLIDTYQFLLSRMNGASPEEVKDYLRDHFFTLISTCAIFFKDETFKSEEEYRIACPKIFPSKESVDGPDIFFRAQHGMIIPFTLVNFTSRLPITNVTLGPKNNMEKAKAGLTYFLESNGYETKHILIESSVASLRY